MEVSSSTTTPEAEDPSTSVVQEFSTAEIATSPIQHNTVSVVATSSDDSDELNNVAEADEEAGSLAFVYQGPTLPPNFYSSDSIDYSKDIKDSMAVQGSCGLQNLGNTCYMNSGIQSLFSCAPLMNFFSESYVLTNESRHTLTAQFYMLLCKMWSGKFSAVHPKEFKDYLSLHHSQFEGFRQHDCQEFLALVLDTLHEQLNVADKTNGATAPPSPCLGVSPILSSSSLTLANTLTSSVEISRNTSELSSLTSSSDERITTDIKNNSFDSIKAASSINPDENPSPVPKYIHSVPPEAEELLETRIGPLSSPVPDGSMTSEISLNSSSNQSDVHGRKSPDLCEEDEITSSLFPPLKHYTSRSNLDDVTSTDPGFSSKPSLKRVSSVSSMSASVSGILFTSEDSNQSSISAHSTDSEQSSAFKRLRIESKDVNKNNNAANKDSVTSSSDCKKNFRSPVEDDSSKQFKEVQRNIVSSINSNYTNNKHVKTDTLVCRTSQAKVDHAYLSDSALKVGLPNLEDFYSKETKTLNTNVLVSDFLNEIATDSEKFAKVDNRSRPLSREVNILQEEVEDENKANKVLLGQRLSSGIKQNNLFVETNDTNIGKVKNLDTNILNNALSQESASIMLDNVSKLPEETSNIIPDKIKGNTEDELVLKFSAASPLSPKLDEEEKNVQMQAFAKFNTRPVQSNIRTDLTDKSLGAHSMEVDDPEIDSSEEEEESSLVLRQSVGECSAVPNCLRPCPAPSEVVMANAAWEDYLSRNQSVVVSTFQGQFRSTVVCSECGHVSVTYEPFMYLSLPIPHAMEQQISVTFICQRSEPVRYLLNLLKTDTVGTAKTQLQKLLGYDTDLMVMAEVLDSHISRILDDNILLKHVNIINRKIYAYDAVSIQENTEANVDSSSCQCSLNNKENESKSFDCNLPISCQNLSYMSDSQLSNHSFDSVNVNSPSSRGTLDMVLSDSDIYESSVPTNSPTLNLCIADEPGQGCQSTSQENFSCFNPTMTMLNKDSIVSSYISANMVDNSVSTSTVWENNNIKDSCEFSRNIPVTQESNFTQTSLNYISNSKLLEKDNELVPADLSINCVTSSSPYIPTQTAHSDAETSFHQTRSLAVSSTSGIGSSIGSSKLSRSCPSPEIPSSPTSSLNEVVSCQDATLFAVAERLGVEEEPGCYFFQTSPRNEIFSHACNEEMSNPLSQLSSTHANDCPVNQIKSSHEDLTQTAQDDEARSTQLMEWKSCAICLEDMLDADLLTHMACGGIFCHSCLQMSIKHAGDIAAFCCPICLHPANAFEDFIPLANAGASKPLIRMIPISLAFRQNIQDNTGAQILKLYGHPNVLYTPSVVSGSSLYGMVDSMISNFPDSRMEDVFESYTILLTDGQGLSCSRCSFPSHCSGCQVPRQGEVTLHPSDCLTVQAENTISVEHVQCLEAVRDHVSMEGQRSSQPTTIMDCFGAFTQSETLDEQNPWYCPQCEKNQCAKKTMTVWRYPDNLIIHLKRFVYQDLSSTKVDTKVVFPHTDMDVRGFLSGPSPSGLVYDLYSTVCHFGGASAGHYTCFSRHPLTHQWYYYNDETVTEQVPSENEYSSGYLLFYQRQGQNIGFTPPQLVCDSDYSTDSLMPSTPVSSSLKLSEPSEVISLNNRTSFATPQSSTFFSPVKSDALCEEIDNHKTCAYIECPSEPDSTLDFYS